MAKTKMIMLIVCDIEDLEKEFGKQVSKMTDEEIISTYGDDIRDTWTPRIKETLIVVLRPDKHILKCM